jgi:uncharacterized protein YkwD
VLVLRRALRAPLPAVLLLTLALVLPMTAAAQPAHTATPRVEHMLSLINAERAARGLQPVTLRTDLNRAAGAHNRSMAAAGRLSHSNLGGICCFRSAGENVGYGSTLVGIHQMLMASPGHRANVLKAGYDEVGFGIRVANGRLWVTQIFRDRR